MFKIDNINRSKYIENIEFFDINMKIRRFAYVYSPYKELEGDAMKFERTNENASVISYTIKLVDDSTYLTKSLEIVDAFLDNIVKTYNRKSILFMQYGTQWLIYKFNITKAYFEKFIKNGGTQNFHKFIYNGILYPDPTRLLPVSFHNRGNIREASSVEYQENVKFS